MATTAQTSGSTGDSAREAVVRVVESYINGLGGRDLGGVPFAEDVTYESPISPKRTGKQAVVEFLSGLFPIINGIRIKQHIVEGEYCATIFDLDTAYGVIAVFDCFRVTDGELKQIAPFYDPSPITNAQQA
jgi:hypothetical protein